MCCTKYKSQRQTNGKSKLEDLGTPLWDRRKVHYSRAKQGLPFFFSFFLHAGRKKGVFCWMTFLIVWHTGLGCRSRCRCRWRLVGVNKADGNTILGKRKEASSFATWRPLFIFFLKIFGLIWRPQNLPIGRRRDPFGGGGVRAAKWDDAEEEASTFKLPNSAVPKRFLEKEEAIASASSLHDGVQKRAGPTLSTIFQMSGRISSCKIRFIV